MKPIINYIINSYDFLFKHSYYYLYVMTVYHILIILSLYYLEKEFANHVWFSLSLQLQDIFTELSTIQYLAQKMLWITIIILLDLFLLTIFMIEFERLNLTVKKIVLLEIVIFSVSFYSLIVRDVMFFLSINTLQIYLVFKTMKYIPFLKIVFITGAYIYIFQLIYAILKVSLNG